MDQDSSETLYAVTITAVKDGAAKIKIAEQLSQTSKGRPAVGRILAKLEELPWTLARNLNGNAAMRLRIRLERIGASVEIVPPIHVGDLPTVAELPESISRGARLPQKPLQGRPPSPSVPGMAETPGGSGEALRAPTSEATTGGFTLQPLSLGGILDRTFQICRGNFWKLLAIAAIPALISGGMTLIGALAVAIVGLTWQSLQGLSPWILIVGAVLLIPSIVLVLIGLIYLSQGALIHAISFIYLGREVRVREAYRFVLARLGRFVLTSFLMALAAMGFVFVPIFLGAIFYFVFSLLISGWKLIVLMVFASLFLLVIPLYGIAKLLLFDKVVIIENKAYITALKRSWDLISGKADDGWPRSFFIRLVVLLHVSFFIILTIYVLFQTPGALLSMLLSEWRLPVNILSQLLTTIGNVVGTLFGSVCLVVFYYDLRIRKEAFDLNMMLAALESRE